MSAHKEYFATLCAPSQTALQQLRQLDIDLVRQTAKPLAVTAPEFLRTVPGADATALAPGFSVDAIVSLEQIGLLVSKGFVVVVRRQEEPAAMLKSKTIDAETWIAQAKGGVK
jgi:hypothetical protein